MQDAGGVSESWNLALDSTPPWFLPACNGGAHPCPEPLQSILAETGGEGLIPFALPRVLAGVLRVALVCMRNSVPHRIPGEVPQGAVALVVGFLCFGLPLVGFFAVVSRVHRCVVFLPPSSLRHGSLLLMQL